MNLVYGPTPSLRYGSTLSVNLLGKEKVCSYNCAYCDLGPTTLIMNKIRKEYVFPGLDEIRTAFREYIRQTVPTDTIVVSGNGEPTLHSDFEAAMRLICELRDEHLPGIPVVVLSSGAHLESKKVVAGMNLADERVIKVDAGSDPMLQKVNAPLIRINLPRLLAGIHKLKDCVVQSLFFSGELENSSNEAIEDWIEILGMIKPKYVQICTLNRPSGVNTQLHALREDALYSIAFKLKKRTNLEAKVFCREGS
ncbi:MAG: radical SAM protein [Bdellovibrionales bacterium]